MLAPILPALSPAAARAAAPSLRSWLMLGPILPAPPPAAARASTPPPRRSLSSSVFYAHPSLTPQLRSARPRPRRSTGSAPPPAAWGLFRLGVVGAPDVYPPPRPAEAKIAAVGVRDCPHLAGAAAPPLPRGSCARIAGATSHPSSLGATFASGHLQP
ncbi:atherin-like isoform X1 [Panicum virgatum]|uniref:atherin-like isoform X1 n=1 Tax=Panicum virgatum TaxID=38727 RepID=UPI0019D5FCD3|nr:atherin-like isoform X1 [Panicum virgatum]